MDINEICRQFGINAVSSEKLSEGHINRTFIITADTGQKYILQSLNSNIFHHPKVVMQNISTTESTFSGCDTVQIPHYLLSKGRNFIISDSEIWRMYGYITESGNVNAYQTGFSFGTFIKTMDGCKLAAEPPIDNFHSFKTYLSRLEAVAGNTDIRRFIRLGEYLSDIFSDDIPKRIIHGDAKTANVITGQKCTVIDLDTIMYGFAALDYGDMIRSVCGKGIDFQAVADTTRGFADGLDGILTKKENDTLFSGILWVTGELSMRYMTDYLSNEGYFSGKTPEQCLERSDALLKLLDEFIHSENELKSIICENFH